MHGPAARTRCCTTLTRSLALCGGGTIPRQDIPIVSPLYRFTSVTVSSAIQEPRQILRQIFSRRLEPYFGRPHLSPIPYHQIFRSLLCMHLLWPLLTTSESVPPCAAQIMAETNQPSVLAEATNKAFNELRRWLREMKNFFGSL